MKYRAFMLAVVAVTIAPQSQPVKPIVVPMFEGGGPAFVIQCQNATGAAVNLNPGNGTSIRMWLDGTLDQPQGIGGSGGARPIIPPGASWREMIALHPIGDASGSMSSSYVGLAQRMDKSLDLTHGRHTVSFECGGGRSDEVAFYWKDVPK